MSGYIDYYGYYSDIVEKAKTAANTASSNPVSSTICSVIEEMINSLNGLKGSVSANGSDSTISNFISIIDSDINKLTSIKEFLDSNYTNAEKAYIELDKTLDLLKTTNENLKNKYNKKPKKSDKKKPDGTDDLDEYKKRLKKWENDIKLLEEDCKSLKIKIDEYLSFLKSVDGCEPTEGRQIKLRTPSFEVPPLKFGISEVISDIGGKFFDKLNNTHDILNNATNLFASNVTFPLASHALNKIIIGNSSYDVQYDDNNRPYALLNGNKYYVGSLFRDNNDNGSRYGFFVSNNDGRRYTVFNQNNLNWPSDCNRAGVCSIVSGYADDDMSVVSSAKKCGDGLGYNESVTNKFLAQYGLTAHVSGSKNDVRKFDVEKSTIIGDLNQGGKVMVHILPTNNQNGAYGASGQKWASSMHWIDFLDTKTVGDETYVFVSDSGHGGTINDSGTGFGEGWYNINEFDGLNINYVTTITEIPEDEVAV